jgi:hypothetical protein
LFQRVPAVKIYPDGRGMSLFRLSWPPNGHPRKVSHLRLIHKGTVSTCSWSPYLTWKLWIWINPIIFASKRKSALSYYLVT